MDLIEIASLRWTVLAVCDHRDDCQVLDFLGSHSDTPAARQMLAMLKEYVPTNGTPKHNQNMSKHLDGNIFEFKKGPKTGKKLRVLYFFDEGNVVVCTTAFTKGEKTPDGVIDAAENVRTDYLNAKKSKKLNIVKL